MTRRPLLPAAVIAAAALSGHALAQPPSGTVQRCASAYEEAQRRQARGELIAGREHAGICAAESCPAEIVSYCAKLAEELDRSIPSVVVALLDGAGRDVDARVLVDEREAQPHIDGRALRLDPGRHRLRLVPAGGLAPVDLEVTLRIGEQNRRVEGRLPAEPQRPDMTAKPAQPSIGYTPAIVAFAVAAVGLGVGATTGILALAQDAELEDLCPDAPRCDPQYSDDVDRADSLGVVSTVGFVAFGLGAAAGVILTVVATQSKPRAVQPTTTGLRVRF